MNYFSMFSGIGGFELGIHRAWGKLAEQGFRAEKGSTCINNESWRLGNEEPHCIGFSEIDKYAIQKYTEHFPNHKEYGNATEIDWSTVPDIDFLCGGFPCQAFSVAGKRGGFTDTRGTLFFEVARGLREKQPRRFLLENVKGLLSHDEGRTYAIIMSTLEELGYHAEWQVLNSKDFGVPQNRERTFIIGHLRGTRRPEVFPFTESDRLPQEGGQEGAAPGEISTAITADYRKGVHSGGETYVQEITSGMSDAQRVYEADGLAKTLKGLGGGQGANTGLYVVSDSGLHRQPQIRYDLSAPLRANTGAGHNNSVCGIRRLTPTECERLQSFDDGWTEGLSDTQRYKCLGNAVTVNVIQAIMERLLLC